MVIVANRTLGGTALADAVRERIADGPVRFHLLVPIPSPVSSAVAVGAAAADMVPAGAIEMGSERQQALDHLEYGLDWLRSLGADVVGDLLASSDTAQAVADDVAAVEADEVIVSTLPATISRWLHQDLPSRLQRKVTVPVTVVTRAA